MQSNDTRGCRPGCEDGPKEVRADGRTDEEIGERTDERTARYTDEEIDGRTDSLMERRTNGRTNGRTDGYDRVCIRQFDCAEFLFIRFGAAFIKSIIGKNSVNQLLIAAFTVDGNDDVALNDQTLLISKLQATKIYYDIANLINIL